MAPYGSWTGAEEIGGILSIAIEISDLQSQVDELREKIQIFEESLLTISHVAPDKLIEPVLRIADGTNWDPGSGAGLYLRQGGAWVKL